MALPDRLAEKPHQRRVDAWVRDAARRQQQFQGASKTARGYACRPGTMRGLIAVPLIGRSALSLTAAPGERSRPQCGIEPTERLGDEGPGRPPCAGVNRRT